VKIAAWRLTSIITGNALIPTEESKAFRSPAATTHLLAGCRYSDLLTPLGLVFKKG
jgi:hypothetical protein